ncbi:unnamed protein product, partial [Symbiodinium sp. CCMP2456]
LRCDRLWNNASAFVILYQSWVLLRDEDRCAVFAAVIGFDAVFGRAMFSVLCWTAQAARVGLPASLQRPLRGAYQLARASCNCINQMSVTALWTIWAPSYILVMLMAGLLLTLIPALAQDENIATHHDRNLQCPRMLLRLSLDLLYQGVCNGSCVIHRNMYRRLSTERAQAASFRAPGRGRPHMEDNSDEELVDPLISDGESVHPDPNEPRRGPPPPIPVFPPQRTEAIQRLSWQISSTVASLLQLNGTVITYIPRNWQELTRIAVVIRQGTPADSLHPDLLYVSDRGPSSEEGDHRGARPGTTGGVRESRATRLTEAELDAMLDAADDMDLNLDEILADTDDDAAEEIPRPTAASSSAPPPPAPATNSSASPKPRAGTSRKWEAYGVWIQQARCLVQSLTFAHWLSSMRSFSQGTGARRPPLRGRLAEHVQFQADLLTARVLALLITVDACRTHGHSTFDPTQEDRPAKARHIQNYKPSGSQVPELLPVAENFEDNSQLPEERRNRLRVVSWNAGGLAGHTYREVLTWLQGEHEDKRPVDLCVLQETGWQEDLEFTTSQEVANAADWHVIHSAGEGKDKSGVMCLIRKTLLPADSIRTATLVPGRLLHVRLLTAVPVDFLCVYQQAWNLQNTSLRGPNKTDALIRLRRRIWDKVDRWLGSIPQRNGCVLIGDFNSSVSEEQPICGAGLPQPDAPGHPDQGALMELLRAHKCCALNTWGRQGSASRTYLPPGATSSRLGTQIDFIITRGSMTDTVSKQASAFDAPFVAVSGCRHRPIQAYLPAPRRPTTQQGSRRLQPRQVQQLLRQPAFQLRLHQQVRSSFHAEAAPDCLDELLITGWEKAARTSPPAAQHTGSGCAIDHDGPLACQVKCMWSLRDLLRRLGEDIHTWRQGPPPAGAVFQAWATATKLQTHTRALRKACRSRKIVAIAEAVSSTNIHQAARRFAPKAPRRRLQLRKADGSLQTHEEELHQISEYFTKLYDGTPGTHRPRLTQDLQISRHELLGALLRLQPSKAMPSNSAPAALWKHFGQDVLPLMERLFAQHLVAGCQALPDRWNQCDMALLPKPNKSLQSPAHLRPICLLSFQAKTLAAVLAGRIQPYVAVYLTDTPQFAYVAQRSLSQALERVISHCAAVRTLVQQHVQTPHTRRQGRPNLSLYGGCQLSLDITCAYDHVPRWALEAAMRDAHIPETLIQAVLLIHDQAFVRITHCGQETSFKLRRGLRQGCGLAPILWTLYSGWVLKQMHSPPILDVSKAATTYADDQHYAWLIRKGQDLENAYQAMKHVFRCLLDNDMQISVDKTVILLELQGPQATKALTRYVVQRPTGPHMKFVIQGASMLIKLVTRHVYLGAVITYRRFEQESYRHRLKLAKNSYTRLGKILRNHSDSLDQRPQKWPKPGPKGTQLSGRRGGKGRRPQQSQGANWDRSNDSWNGSEWARRQPQDPRRDQRRPQRGQRQEDDQSQQLAELKAIVTMLTSLVLRQEVQLNICRQDTAYVIFLQTQGEDSLARSLYVIGEQWHRTKSESPDQLKAPLRVIMFQHFIEMTKTRFTKMMETPSSRSQALERGLLTEAPAMIPGLRWDPIEKRHVKDPRVTPLKPEEVLEAMDRLLILSSQELVINRFHGMRKLSEEYASPSIGMFLELGLRTGAANEAWNLLHKLSQSAAWMATGGYLRHEHLHLSALAKRLAAVTK